MREIVLTRGYVAIVDDEDYERFGHLKWHAFGTYPHVYAARHTSRRLGPRKSILLHRAVLDAPHGMQVDHADQDTMNNRRSNLRLCTHQQNMMNRRPNTGRLLKGAYFNKSTGKWDASIRLEHETIHLGSFDTEVEAARAYDAAAPMYHGEFARLNYSVAA